MSRFDDCLSVVLQFEGGYSDRPNDRGGATMKGITQKTYDAFRLSQGLPIQPVKVIGDDEVWNIYKSEYWAKAKCDQLPIPVDLAVFDGAVQHGIPRAVKCLQEACGASVDGVMGPETIMLAHTGDPVGLANEVIEVRRQFYTEIVSRDPTQMANYHGWMNRLQHLETEIA